MSHPAFRFELQNGFLAELERRLVEGALDLAFAPLHGERSPVVQQRILLHLPLALMLPDSNKIRRFDLLLKKDRSLWPALISSNRDTLVHFQSELNSRGVEWSPSIELPSQALAPQYVRQGFGAAVVLHRKGFKTPVGTRILPLPEFAPLPVGALWVGRLGAAHELLLREAESIARLPPVEPR
jgi:DNA-binding transcriptional LysR family regulator